jgi:tRNA-dihydrouridine synthase
MAPMLGITDSAYRTAFMRSFGGLDLAITPFIKTIQGGRYKESKLADLLPSRNRQISIIPQILSNNSADVIVVATELFDMGYDKININFGCPVPMTAGRGRGAGLLPHPEFVDRFLDEILAVIPNKLSIKTRIGFDRTDQLLLMAKVFNRYPLCEIAVHPRTARQGYSGLVNHEAFAEVLAVLNAPIIYSGDINSLETFIDLIKLYPEISSWMIGRGALGNPNLPALITRYLESGDDGEGIEALTPAKLVAFYDEICRELAIRNLAKNHILARAKTLFYYHADFCKTEKHVIRAVRKSKSIEQFLKLASESTW